MNQNLFSSRHGSRRSCIIGREDVDCVKHAAQVLKRSLTWTVREVLTLTPEAINEGWYLNSPSSHAERTTNSETSAAETTVVTVPILKRRSIIMFVASRKRQHWNQEKTSDERQKKEIGFIERQTTEHNCNVRSVLSCCMLFDSDRPRRHYVIATSIDAKNEGEIPDW